MRLSPSKIGMFTCPRKGYYAYELGIESMDKNMVPIAFGQAIHSGIVVLFKCGELGEAIRVAKKELGENKQKHRNPEKLEELMTCYYNLYYKNMTWEPMAENPRMVTETVVDGQVVQVEGTLDIPVGRLNGVITLQEFKTTTIPGMFVTKPNMQTAIYTWLARKSLDITVEQVLYTIFEINNSKNGVVNTIAGERYVVNQFIEPIEEWEIEEVEVELKTIAENMLTWKRTNVWPRQTSVCGMYGGCEYKTLCMADLETREFLIKNNYKQKQTNKKEV